MENQDLLLSYSISPSTTETGPWYALHPAGTPSQTQTQTNPSTEASWPCLEAKFSETMKVNFVSLWQLAEQGLSPTWRRGGQGWVQRIEKGRGQGSLEALPVAILHSGSRAAKLQRPPMRSPGLHLLPQLQPAIRSLPSPFGAGSWPQALSPLTQTVKRRGD